MGGYFPHKCGIIFFYHSDVYFPFVLNWLYDYIFSELGQATEYGETVI